MNRRQIDIALLALCALSALAVAGVLGPLRPLIVLAAMCLVPGGAILTRLPVRDGLTMVALMIGLSLGVDIVGSLAITWGNVFHPALLWLVLGAGSAALLVADLQRADR
jgi:hypothetical protein